ncbi:hypothetical protein [Vibrio owensii]|uniref:hypothetical protein n=1 Tax=Vibrio harveyi group TaxID=717610 RepID=UPI003CC5A08D
MEKHQVIKTLLENTNSSNIAISVWDYMCLGGSSKALALELTENFSYTKFDQFWEQARPKHTFAAKFEKANARRDLLNVLFPFPVKVSALSTEIDSMGCEDTSNLWKTIISDMNDDRFFAIEVHANVMNYGTTSFRELVTRYGDYWNDLKFANQVDGIDAAFARLL